MINANHRLFVAGLLLVLGWQTLLSPAPLLAQTINAPDTPTPTLDVADVRIGMKGYGLTVFHGTKSEPFNVEVVSIVPNSVPARSVVWVRCPDPRMIESGPVQGMSGSPIYLWTDDEEHELGRGGKLIGAFAFGYTDSQQCMVGVQPIAYMRESASRVQPADAQADRATHGSARHTVAMLRTLKRLPQMADAPALSRVRHDLQLDLMQRVTGLGTDTTQTEATDTVRGPGAGTRAKAMLLPIGLGSAEAADVFGPLLKPMGLLAVASDAAAVGGTPPSEVDVQAVALEPGSVLSVPLAYGDMDLSASGTVTDVLPGGEVLGFGHPMFGLGAAQVPMATGYVHFVMPRRSISFKNAGSLTPLGTLVRDEGAAVVGVAGARYSTAAVDVVVNMPGDQSRSYHYQVVNEPMLSANLVANVVFSSVQAVYDTPLECTLRIRGQMRFEGGRVIDVDTLIAGGNSIYAVMELLPPISILVQNPYESLDIESVNVTVDIEQGIRQATITGARLQRTELAPGEDAVVHVELQHYGGKTEQRPIRFTVPEDLDEGDYQLMISGADNYTSLKVMSQPNIQVTESVDDLIAFIQETMAYRADALYATIVLPEAHLAVGQTEMPDLPGSRAALLSSPTTTETMLYPRLYEQVYPTDTVILGQVGFPISVRQP